MRLPFETGKQPCAAFNPRYAEVGGNLHDCYGPYDARGHVPGAPYCGAKVSLCENCLSDHHTEGWETCGRRVERPKNPPRHS